jgi:hypothetical protein
VFLTAVVVGCPPCGRPCRNSFKYWKIEDGKEGEKREELIGRELVESIGLNGVSMARI